MPTCSVFSCKKKSNTSSLQKDNVTFHIMELNHEFKAMKTNKQYSNFVRPTSPTLSRTYKLQTTLNGEEARKLYLEEVSDVKDPVPATDDNKTPAKGLRKHKRKTDEIQVSDKDLFVIVQNNDVETLKMILDKTPDKINLADDYGWSLLMIACQANSVETVKELLKRGIDTSIRDKAGNSAQSLVIKNKNFILASILLDYKSNKPQEPTPNEKLKKVKLKEEFVCPVCNNKSFPDKQVHLSSTIHNINTSKGKKIPANFVIPESNRGYQIMVKVGWDKESGLGPDGSGTKYPIKTTQKKDRKGLGLEKKKEENVKETQRSINKKTLAKDYLSNRRREINFRREFY